jgi:ABC-2 type transport system permease protein
MLNNVLRIARKELATFFNAPTAYIFLGAFLAAMLFIFFWVETFFARIIADVRPLFEWMPVLLIFLVSAVTMKMWSEERRMGTLEYLMTLPAETSHLVAGKFLACWALVGAALVLTLPLPITVSFMGDLDWGPVLGGYLATAFLSAAYTALGLYISSKTDSQIVSLILSVLAGTAFYAVGSDVLTSLMGNRGAEWSEPL